MTMTFPVWIPLGSWRAHPHLVFDALAYLAAFVVYRMTRSRRGDVVDSGVRGMVAIAALVGAGVGAKVLAWLDDPAATVRLWAESPLYALQGRSVVGAILGGTAAVRFARRRLGVATATGDLFVLPLCLSIAVGRVGCFLTGLADRTHGIATSLPTGVDFGDGVPRHPLPLYECAILIGLAAGLARRDARLRATRPPGALFDGFAALYMSWRFAVDFLKPDATFYFGLGGVQLAALGGVWWFRGGLRSLASSTKGLAGRIAFVPISSMTSR